jgi:hypothetical protein
VSNLAAPQSKSEHRPDLHFAFRPRMINPSNGAFLADGHLKTWDA